MFCSGEVALNAAICAGDVVLNAAIGAGSGYVGTKWLALCGVKVASPPIGALYGALFVTTIISIDIEADSTIGKIARLVAKFFIATAVAMGFCYLYGSPFTLTNAVILSAATLSLSVIGALALIHIIKNGGLNLSLNNI